VRCGAVRRLSERLTLEQLDDGGNDGDGVLGDEGVFAKILRLDGPEAEATFDDHDPRRPFLK